MFRLTKEHTYWWPVPVALPDPDPAKAGQMIEQTFKIRFNAMGRDEAIALQATLSRLPADERLTRENEQIERETLDWSDVVDEAGQAIPFSVENFRAAMQSSWFRIAVFKAYLASLQGEAARLKN